MKLFIQTFEELSSAWISHSVFVKPSDRSVTKIATVFLML